MPYQQKPCLRHPNILSRPRAFLRRPRVITLRMKPSRFKRELSERSMSTIYSSRNDSSSSTELESSISISKRPDLWDLHGEGSNWIKKGSSVLMFINYCPLVIQLCNDAAKTLCIAHMTMHFCCRAAPLHSCIPSVNAKAQKAWIVLCAMQRCIPFVKQSLFTQVFRKSHFYTVFAHA